MRVLYTDNAKSDIEYWKKSNNLKIQTRIKSIIDSIKETPFSGIGKPEPLKYGLKGSWSRRINLEHRITYTVENDAITILSLRYHYV